MRPRFLPALGLLLASCATEPKTLTIDVVTGHEAAAFREDPPVVRVEVTATAVGGGASASASSAPGGALDFGEIDATAPITIEVRGVDARGATVMRGRSVAGIEIGAVEGDVLPVFAQRLGRWARPPGELAAARIGASGGVLAERYVFVTGGEAVGTDDPARLDAYDLLSLGGSASGALPRAAHSLVARGDTLLLIDAQGASWVNVGTGERVSAVLPGGLAAFSEVAGGRTVEAEGGRSFVVGATRAGAATDAVLVVGADGALSAARLSAKRKGAAAVWLDSAGLVVAGGSNAGAGVEVLAAAGGASSSPRPFPPDPAQGAGAAVVGPGEIALVGGILGGAPAPTRRLAPGCEAGCAATPVAGGTLPAQLTDVAAFALPGGRVLAVGTEISAAALMRSFVVDLSATQAAEIPLREPRRGATAVPAPNGTLMLLGGAHPDGTPATSVEALFPE